MITEIMHMTLWLVALLLTQSAHYDLHRVTTIRWSIDGPGAIPRLQADIDHQWQYFASNVTIALTEVVTAAGILGNK